MIGQTIRKNHAGNQSGPASDSSGSSTMTTVARFHQGSGSWRAESIPRYGVNASTSTPMTGTVATARATISPTASHARSAQML